MAEDRAKCTGMTKAGEPCGSFAARDGLCVSHHPELNARKLEGSRKGGEAKANARRAARQWAAMGAELKPSELPDVLRACMFAVRDGSMEPAQAQAVAALAKASVSLAHDLELEARITALEEAINAADPPANVRRLSA